MLSDCISYSPGSIFIEHSNYKDCFSKYIIFKNCHDRPFLRRNTIFLIVIYVYFYFSFYLFFFSFSSSFLSFYVLIFTSTLLFQYYSITLSAKNVTDCNSQEPSHKQILHSDVMYKNITA